MVDLHTKEKVGTVAGKSSHAIGRKARDIIQGKINAFQGGRSIFRNLSDIDYGIDGIMEIFNEDLMPAGQIAYLQIKGTETTLVPLKRTPD